MDWTFTMDGNGRYESLDDKLILACDRGLTERVRELLERGADVNYKHPICGWTPLHRACAGGHVDVVKVLLAQPHLDVEATTTQGNTALHVACKKNFTEAALLLLRAPSVLKTVSQFESLVEKRNAKGCMALHFACRAQNLTLVKALLRNFLYGDLDFEVDDLVKLADHNTQVRRALFTHVRKNLGLCG